MAEIQEVRLPGVGIRHDFVTNGGRRVGVIVHHSRHRELLVYDQRDPDTTSEVVHLEQEDTRVLAELLGASHVSEEVTKAQSVEGLTIDWLPVEPGATATRTPLAATRLREETGVLIVAVLREGTMIPTPSGDFQLRAGDTAVTVGSPAGLREAFELLRGS